MKSMLPPIKLGRRARLLSGNRGGRAVEEDSKLVFLAVEDGIEDPKADIELCDMEPPLDKDIGVGGKP